MKPKFKNKHFFLLLFLFFVPIHSCKYEPTEDFNHQLNKNVPPPDIQITGLNPASDTIYLLSDTTINLKFSCTYNIEEIVFFVNDNSTNLTFVGDGSGDGYKRGPTNGIHKLTIDLYTGSGTNSIADKIGKEAYKFSKTWYLFVKGEIDSDYNATFENGIATIKWVVYHY